MTNRFFDNTAIQAFRTCPRYYWFRHVRDWRMDGDPRPPLVFGGAWHKAMDALWADICWGKTDDATAIDNAMKAFLAEWEGQGMPGSPGPDEQRLLGARTPGTAHEMLYCYVERYGDWLREIELIAIEQPFVVPLSPDEPLHYIGRLDKVYREGRSVNIREHKTTTAYRQNGPFQAAWVDSFSPDSQIDGYSYAGRMLYGDEFNQVVVDGALVHKTVHDGFKPIPVKRPPAQLDAWLWEVRHWIDEIDRNHAAELSFSQDPVLSNPTYMPAWPKNTNSCYQYNSACPYLNLCKARANPLQFTEPPMGFVQDKWEPYQLLNIAKIMEGGGS